VGADPGGDFTPEFQDAADVDVGVGRAVHERDDRRMDAEPAHHMTEDKGQVRMCEHHLANALYLGVEFGVVKRLDAA